MLKNIINSDMTAITHYGKEYLRVENTLAGHQHEKLKKIRLTALQEFSLQGFPNKKQEDWKYTSLTALRQTSFSLSVLAELNLDPSLLDPLSNNAIRLVFINGFFAKHLSMLTPLPNKVKITHFSDMLNHHSEELNAIWPCNDTLEKNSFTHLNTAFMQDGAYIHLPAHTHVATPIEILFINTDETADRFIPLRNLIIAEENSQATIIEKYIDMTQKNNATYFTNTVSECYLAANSHIQHYKYVTESKRAIHVGNLCVSQQQNSQFSAYSLALSGQLIRNDVYVKLEQPNAQCQLKGLYYALDQQQVDHHTVIDHRSPHTHSEEFYKGIIDAKARAVFNGKVIVREHAIKSKAQQLNKNLLLSPQAEINTKPQLEIFTDDIQCTHGASIGQLDKEALFYLRARGLTATQATDLLIKAFIQDILEQMPLFNNASLPNSLKNRLVHS